MPKLYRRLREMILFDWALMTAAGMALAAFVGYMAGRESR